LPAVNVHALWIMKNPPGAISTSSQATATKEAALAAYPSTWATIRAGWFRMAASMARAANTSPPGELIRRWMVGTSRAFNSFTNFSAEMPPQ
jgi:hypothetical protein